MIGAETLVRTLLACGVDTTFANPGTSEMHFCAALDRAPGMRSILGLFEGVVSGAADGYARMKGKPAATLFHCGPGLANALANFHNAKKSETPIVNIVGDQATYHAPLDPPLASDVEGFARPVSQWVKRVMHTETLGDDASEAVQASYRPPGGIATLILPSDVSWNEGGTVGQPRPIPKRAKVDARAIREAAAVLKTGEPALLFLGGAALTLGLNDAHRIAAKTGVRLMAPTFNARIARGQGRYPIPSMPYPVDEAVKLTAGIRHVILAGTGEAVAFFAYPNKPSVVTPKDAAVHVLAKPESDAVDALARLADELDCPPAPTLNRPPPPEPARGAMNVEGAAQTVGALLREDAIVVDEAITLRGPFFAGTRNAAPHDWLQVPGGSIGDGLPLATGAAVAAPDRRVVAIQADGSAMYTIQSLWTQAREKLDVTNIILSNRKYAVLLHELKAVGAVAGKTALDLFEIDRPELGFIAMANGMGVEAARADTLEQFADLFRHANARRGPFLIELPLG